MTLTALFLGFRASAGTGQSATVENATAIGSFAYTTASDQIALGSDAVIQIRALGADLMRGDLSKANYFFGPSGVSAANGSGNLGIGFDVLRALDSGDATIAMGYVAANLFVAGTANVAVGDLALAYAMAADDCTAIGSQVMRFNHGGSGNTAIGKFTLSVGQGTGRNTAVGDSALRFVTTGDANTGIGYRAAETNTIGNGNVFVGTGAWLHRAEGDENVALGYSAAWADTLPANRSVALGCYALRLLGSDDNAGVGYKALFLSAGVDETALGARAGALPTNGEGNIYIGADAATDAGQFTTPINSIAIGVASFTSASDQCVVGGDLVAHSVLQGAVGIGIGMVAPEGALHASAQDEANVVLFEAADQTNDAEAAVLALLASKIGAPGDGFGAALALAHREEGQPENVIAAIGAVRADADDLGIIRLQPSVAGTLAFGLSVRGGSVAITETSAPVLGGDPDAGYLFSDADAFGIYYGDGAPTITADQGALYLRTDGSGISDRAYVNIDGSTGWTALQTHS